MLIDLEEELITEYKLLHRYLPRNIYEAVCYVHDHSWVFPNWNKRLHNTFSELENLLVLCDDWEKYVQLYNPSYIVRSLHKDWFGRYAYITGTKGLVGHTTNDKDKAAIFYNYKTAERYCSDAFEIIRSES